MDECDYGTTDGKRLIGVWIPILPASLKDLGYWYRTLIALRFARRRLKRKLGYEGEKDP